MLPQISDWDLALIDQLADPDLAETLNLERKAEGAFELSASGTVRAKTREEIAKQVCAFSNAEGGFIIFGIKDAKQGGGRDQGVPSHIGKEPIKEWAEKPIPGMNPPVVGCQARFIEYPSGPGRGALVIQVPQSEHRPHWFTDSTGKDWPYLRVGGHSLPMSLRTFMDIYSRGPSPEVEVLDPLRWSLHVVAGHPNMLRVIPTVTLLRGPVADRWGVELHVPDEVGYFDKVLKGNVRADGRTAFFSGAEPLFPGRITRVSEHEALLILANLPPRPGFSMLAICYCESSRPVERRFPTEAVLRIASSRPRT